MLFYLFVSEERKEVMLSEGVQEAKCKLKKYIQKVQKPHSQTSLLSLIQ